MMLTIIVELHMSLCLLDYAGSLRVEDLNNGLEMTSVH
jgi:hypothetical protein